MKRTQLIFILTIITLFSCSTGREVVMPFRNMVYSGERLFPIEKMIQRKHLECGLIMGHLLTE